MFMHNDSLQALINNSEGTLSLKFSQENSRLPVQRISLTTLFKKLGELTRPTSIEFDGLYPNFISPVDLHAMVNALSNNQSLQLDSLSFDGFQHEESISGGLGVGPIRAIMSLVNSKAPKRLSFSSFDLSNSDMHTITSTLQNNNVLEALEFTDGHLTHDDIRYIAQLLEINNTITQLNLEVDETIEKACIPWLKKLVCNEHGATSISDLTLSIPLTENELVDLTISLINSKSNLNSLLVEFCGEISSQQLKQIRVALESNSTITRLTLLEAECGADSDDEYSTYRKEMAQIKACCNSNKQRIEFEQQRAQRQESMEQPTAENPLKRGIFGDRDAAKKQARFADNDAPADANNSSSMDNQSP